MYKRRHHDMGGLKSEKMELVEHDYTVWEKKVDAIVKVLSAEDCKILSVDELRRGIEELGPGIYDDLSYYERWITAASNLLIEKGIISVHDLGKKMKEVETRWLQDRKKIG